MGSFLNFRAKSRSPLLVKSISQPVPYKVRPEHGQQFNNQLVWRTFVNFYQKFFNQNQPYFKVHGFFKPFFLFNLRGNAVCLNYSKLYKRWVVTYKLILNPFFKKLNPLIFTTKVFRKEVTAFN